MIKAAEIRQIRGNVWKSEWTPEQFQSLFEKCGPYDTLYHSASFNLAWFVKQVFIHDGRPLELLAFQQVIMDTLWNKKFPMLVITRGGSKTFLLAVYALLRALLNQGSKIVVMGAGFRQAKHVFRYIEELYNASPLLQEALGRDGGVKWGSDTVSIKVGTSTIRGLPIGDGSKVRGERATHLLADEFASIPESIFDHAVAPFTSVGKSPAAKAEMMAFVSRLKALGVEKGLLDAIQISFGMGNQIVYSGSACHIGNHFGKRYVISKMIIQSGGDPEKLRRALEEKSQLVAGKSSEITAEDIDSMLKTWKQYAIVQIPYTAIPEGFMETDIIRGEKANLPSYRFREEYLAEFTTDTDGFIKRSWIERATPRAPDAPVIPELYGDPRAVYVMGVDPARNNDNIGVVVFKLTSRGKELVYCNAWVRTEYGVSANRIREIAKRFNVSYITMDKGGGGEAIREWLCKKSEDVNPEDFLWVIPDQMMEMTGSMLGMGAPGRKIIEMVNFGSTWISEAAHAVEADIEQANILFPHTGDDISAYQQYMTHFGLNKITEIEKIKLQEDLWGVDIWEAEVDGRKPSMGIMQHITECTNETCAIVRSVTPGGTEHFDLPKLSEQPEGLDMRRRDRWSALMLANYAAKVYMGTGHKPKGWTGMSAGGGQPRGYTNRGPRRRGSAMY
jgi:hypothetical protein